MTGLASNEPIITDDGFKLAAARDLPDLRDQFYRPTLGTLLPRKERDERFFYKKQNALRVAIRDQGETPTCTGQALAALIDILRQQQTVGKNVEPVSARMLYHLATEYEVGHITGGGLLSLRSVIKAFYHYGVCADGVLKAPGTRRVDTGIKPHHWSFSDMPPGSVPMAPVKADEPCSVPPNFLTVDRAKAARKVPLGAYYRIHPRLNDYHAALNETGTLLASANIHEGWVMGRVKAANGEIIYQLDHPLGVHAFVIVGYNEEGFLVLNSWGKNWGGYKGYKGIALWRYGDWADSIQDGWVLRLGVSTPNAFRYSIGEQGLNFSELPIEAIGGRRSIGSTPCLELLGHFAHLDDGYHVTKGPYATSIASVNETVRYLGGSPRWPHLLENKPYKHVMGDDKARLGTSRKKHESYRGVLLWLGGSLEGIKDSVTLAVNRKDRVKAKQLYPYTILWCNDIVEETTAVLARIFDGVKKRVGIRGPALDLAIENACWGIGRALWRDIAAGAEQATNRDHNGADILDSFLSLNHLDIHLVVDGAGAIFLDYYLRFLADHPDRDRLLDNIRSVDFIIPTINLQQVIEKSYWRNFFRRFAGKSKANRLVRVWVPSNDNEDRLCVDVYGKSILHLISNSFEIKPPNWEWQTRRTTMSFVPNENLSPTQRERGLTGPPLFGMATKTSGILTDEIAERWPLGQQLDIRDIPSPSGMRDRLNHHHLVLNQRLFDIILAKISDEAEDHTA